MSTISLPYEKQIRHFFVADALATETTIKTFMSGASIGEMQIFTQDGVAIAGALPPGKDFYLAKKNNKGGISKTDFITPKDITYLKGTKPVAKTGKTQTFTLAAAPTVGAEYQLVGKVHYGNSEENFITFWAGDKAKTGDTANTLLRRLGKQIADNLANSIHTGAKANSGDMQIASAPVVSAKANKYFTVAVAASTLTITEKDWILDDFRVGLRTHDQLMFNFELMAGGFMSDESANITKGGTPGVYAKGQGYQIIELERYLVGHRAEFENLDRTLDFGRKYDTDIAGQYFVLDMKYFDISRDSAKHSDKMLTLVSKDAAVLDAIGAKIVLAGGPAWTTLAEPAP